LKTVPIIGLSVAATTYAGAVDWILTSARRADRTYAVEAANTHVAALARTHPDFGQAMRRFDLITSRNSCR
jgi:N-acetylglucosaminyldiphosphoundecaprenol N-acetyl-beta-D-mannosaminyltransferase